MANAEHFEPLLTSEEAAHHLRMHVETLQRLATQHNRISRPFRVERGEDLEIPA
jgi:hypothetical protein